MDVVAVFLKRGEAEILADVAQHLLGLGNGVENQRALALSLLQLLDERVDQGRLAGAHLAGEDDKAFARVDAVEKSRQRLPVAGAEIEKTRVRGNIEGLAAETEMP